MPSTAGELWHVVQLGVLSIAQSRDGSAVLGDCIAGFTCGNGRATPCGMMVCAWCNKVTIEKCEEPQGKQAYSPILLWLAGKSSHGLYLEPDFQVAILCYTVICFMTRSDYSYPTKKNIRVTVCPTNLAIPNSGTTRPNNFAWVNISIPQCVKWWNPSTWLAKWGQWPVVSRVPFVVVNILLEGLPST